MKKFSKITENNLTNNKYYKVFAKVELIVSSENEGEAGYMAESILASVENNYNYEIQLIEETDNRLDENVNLKK